MDSPDNKKKASIHAERAYALIFSGVITCESAVDQRMLINALICQCATFTRIISGEQEFLALIERLKNEVLDTMGAEASRLLH